MANSPESATVDDVGDAVEGPSGSAMLPTLEAYTLLDPNNPLLERVQKRIERQLRDSLAKLDAEIREKTAELAVSGRKREELGVELYSVQKQLANLQAQVERAEEAKKAAEEKRVSAEQTFAAITSSHSELKNKLDEDRSKYYEAQQQLDKLNIALRQVESYNAETRSRIAISQRATAKTESDIGELEKQKRAQDLLIDTYTEQLKQLEEQYAFHERQLVGQREETKRAQELLSEAVHEMEVLQLEKKQLLQQWNSSLVGMSRRDEALRATEEAVRQQREQLQSMDVELQGYKRSLQAVQEQHEQLTGFLNKLAAEAAFLEKALAAQAAERDRLNSELARLQTALEQAEAALAAVDAEARALAEQLDAAQKAADHFVNETVKLEDTILQNLQLQTTLEKSSASTESSAKKLNAMVREKEMAITQMQNELARIRIDFLNTRAHNEKLRETLKELVDECKEKEALIEKYELELRRRNDVIERKQNEVDRLNKKLDALLSTKGDENNGYLEATLANLQKSIHEKQRECDTTQQYWLRAQTELVALNRRVNEKTKELQDQNKVFAVLKHKHMRLEAALGQVRRDIRELRSAASAIQSDMQRLNELIARNDQLQRALKEANLSLETEFVAALKDAELQCIRLDEAVESVRKEKELILNETVETERQIMQWEKRIQIGLETQAALDPNIGAAEAKGMRQEIHRMRVRLSQLKKRQEFLIQEMEKAVERRDAFVRPKTSANLATQKWKTAVTKTVMSKNLGELAKKIKQLRQQSKDLTENVRQISEAQELLQVQIAKAQMDHDSLVHQEDTLARGKERLELEKHKRFGLLTKYQQLVKKYGAVTEEKLRQREAVVQKELARVLEKREKITQVINALAQEFKHLESELQEVVEGRDNVHTYTSQSMHRARKSVDVVK